jgi:hypothetical protein
MWFLLSLAASALQVFSLMFLWQWFVTPLGFHSLTFLEMCGLRMFLFLTVGHWSFSYKKLRKVWGADYINSQFKDYAISTYIFAVSATVCGWIFYQLLLQIAAMH